MRMRCFDRQFVQLVKIVERMKDEDVTVEDDTCMDRITSALKIICNMPLFTEQVFKQINGDEKDTLFLSCQHILLHNKSYQTSTCSFIIKLLTLFSSENLLKNFDEDRKDTLRSCIKTILDIDIANECIEGHLQYAWLWSICELAACRSTLYIMLQSGMGFERLFYLANSSSIFIERMAHLAISKLIIYLQMLHDDEEESEFLRKQSQSSLEIVSKRLQHTSSLDAVLKILTECLKLDYKNTNTFFIAYFNEPLNYFEREPIEKELLRRCMKVNLIITNFVASLSPSCKWISCEFLHDMVNTGLNRSPTHIGSYTLLSNVAINTKENTDLYCHLLMVPFDVALRNYLDNSNSEDITAWIETMRKTLTSTTKITSALCYSATALSKIWKAGLSKVPQTESNIFSRFNDVLLAVYEIKEMHVKVKPELLQNYKVAAAVLECIKVCIDNTDKCWLCVNEEMTSNFLSLMRHADADHQLLKRCGIILLSLYSCGCSRHSDVKILMSLIELLVDKLCHLRWEEKDTTLELITSTVSAMGSCSEDVKMEFEGHLRRLNLYDALSLRFSDSDSHVRASALEAMTSLLDSTSLCDSRDMTPLLSAASDILTTDEEAFPRRAAVLLLASTVLKHTSVFSQFLLCLVKPDVTVTPQDTKCLIPDQVIRSSINVLLHQVLEDLDWEVKRNGILFLSRIHLRLMQGDILEDINKDARESICKILQDQVEDCNDVVSECAIDHLDVIHNRYDATIQETRKCDSLLEELHSLLDDVEYRCSGNVPLLHHGDEEQDEVSRDCY